MVPVTASEMSGKNVPQNIDEAQADEHEVVGRNAASRESSEGRRCSERSRSRREITSPVDAAIIAAISATNGTPSVDAPKAWIESRIPERTRNVPSTARMPIASASEMFHTFSIPRRSWTMIECRNAVPVSHGISEAFSTGSQAQ